MIFKWLKHRSNVRALRHELQESREFNHQLTKDYHEIRRFYNGHVAELESLEKQLSESLRKQDELRKLADLRLTMATETIIDASYWQRKYNELNDNQ